MIKDKNIEIVKKFDAFLSNNITENKENANYTTIGLKDKSRRKKYHIEKDIENNFLRLYGNMIKSLKKLKARGIYPNKFYDITQLQCEYKPILIDIDIKKKISSPENFKEQNVPRLINNGDIVNLMNLYATVIKSMFSTEFLTSKKIYVSKREYSEIIEKNGSYYIKDGIHAVIPEVIVDNNTQKYIYDQINTWIERSNKLKKFIGTVDKSVIKSTGWLLYGSSKEGTQTYEINYALNINKLFNIKNNDIPDEDDLFIMSSNVVTKHGMKLSDIPLFMNIHKDKENLSKIINTDIIEQIRINDIKKPDNLTMFEMMRYAANKEYSDDDIKMYWEILDNLSSRRYTDYTEWSSIGFCLSSGSGKDPRFYKLWYDFSMKICNELTTMSKRSEYKTSINKIWTGSYMPGERELKTNGEKKSYRSLNSLMVWLKEDLIINVSDPLLKEKGKKKYDEICNKNIVRSVINHYGPWSEVEIAKYVYEQIGKDYKSVIVKRDSTMYNFKDHIWEELNNDGRIQDYIMKDLTEIVRKAHNKINKKYTILLAGGDNTRGNVALSSINAKRSKIEKLLVNLGNLTTINKIVSVFKIMVRDDNFDKNMNQKMHLFAFKNGVYDYIKNEFRPGRREDNITIQAPCDFIGKDINKWNNDQKKQQNDMLKFFEEVFPNKDLLHYVLCILSKCLIGNRNEQVVYVCQGNGGNGKTSIFNLIAKGFGLGYYKKVDIALFTQKRGHASGPNAAMHDFMYSRIVVSSEPDTGNSMNMGLIKEITGNDDISFRGMYEKKNRIFNGQSRIFLHVNKPLRLKEVDDSISRRIIVLPFPSKFIVPGKSIDDFKKCYDYVYYQDSTIPDKIKLWGNSGVYLSYLVYWHYNNVRNKKEIKMPEMVADEVNRYLRSNNHTKTFMDENLIETRNMDDCVSSSEIFNKFQSFLEKKKIKNCDILQDELMEKIAIEYGKRLVKNNKLYAYRLVRPSDRF